MLFRFLLASCVATAALGAPAAESELTDELRSLEWMVGDWKAETIWTKEAAYDPKKFAHGAGNPNMRIEIAENGNALHITYGYCIRSFAIFGGRDVTVEYRYDEKIVFEEGHYKVSGKILRTDQNQVEINFEYDIQLGCIRDWAQKLPGTNTMTRICGEPDSPVHPVFLVARRDDQRSNPNYKPFIPRTPTEKIP